MSNFAVVACRQLAAAADYFVPCPHTSVIAMPGCADWIRSPRAFIGPRGKQTIFTGCTSSCGLCAQFESTLGDVRHTPIAEIAAAWQRHLVRRVKAFPEGREAANLRRLDALGHVPEAMRAELAETFQAREVEG
jgi:hypothetical protein